MEKEKQITMIREAGVIAIIRANTSVKGDGAK